MEADPRWWTEKRIHPRGSAQGSGSRQGWGRTLRGPAGTDPWADLSRRIHGRDPSKRIRLQGSAQRSGSRDPPRDPGPGRVEGGASEVRPGRISGRIFRSGSTGRIGTGSGRIGTGSGEKSGYTVTPRALERKSVNPLSRLCSRSSLAICCFMRESVVLPLSNVLAMANSRGSSARKETFRMTNSMNTRNPIKMMMTRITRMVVYRTDPVCSAAQKIWAYGRVRQCLDPKAKKEYEPGVRRVAVSRKDGPTRGERCPARQRWIARAHRKRFLR